MDWLAWLSKTGLDPTLIYDYALEFKRNELQAEDIPYFDHEFLQSMGISIAKHRLEILKLAKKDSSRPGKRFSGLISALARTKRSVGKYIGWKSSHDETVVKESTETTEDGGRENWRLANYKHRSVALSGPLDGKFHQQKYLTVAHKGPRFSGPIVYGGPDGPNFSGPLDVKSHEKAILALRSPKFSGPIEGRQVVNRSLKFSGPIERAPTRSPKVSAPIEGTGRPGPRSSPRVSSSGTGVLDKEVMVDGFDEHSLWAKLFHDMKPT